MILFKTRYFVYGKSYKCCLNCSVMFSPKALITVYQSGWLPSRQENYYHCGASRDRFYYIPISRLYDTKRTKAAYRSDVCIDWRTTTTEGRSNEPNSAVSNYYYFIMFAIYSVHEIILGMSSDKRALSCMRSTYIYYIYVH